MRPPAPATPVLSPVAYDERACSDARTRVILPIRRPPFSSAREGAPRRAVQRSLPPRVRARPALGLPAQRRVPSEARRAR